MARMLSDQLGASNGTGISGAHVRTGLRRILEFPLLYQSFQRLLSPPSRRQGIVTDYLRPRAGNRVLDIGCGTADILNYLPDDVEYVGYDLNPSYIEAAQRHFGSRGRFFCSNVGGDEDSQLAEAKFDFVLALAVLHHLHDTEVHELVSLALRHLKPGGVFFTLDCVYIPSQSRIARFLISRDRGQAVRTVEGYRDLLGDRFDTVTTYVTHDRLRLPYTHLMMRAITAGGTSASSHPAG